jgi:hypothetical protein
MQSHSLRGETDQVAASFCLYTCNQPEGGPGGRGPARIVLGDIWVLLGEGKGAWRLGVLGVVGMCRVKCATHLLAAKPSPNLAHHPT